MESRPPQDPPRRPAAGRKPNGSGGSPTPPWLWLVLLFGVVLIFWQFGKAGGEVQVNFHPWFTEQVNKGNIKSLAVQTTTEVTGELRVPEPYRATSSSPEITVTKFRT